MDGATLVENIERKKQTQLDRLGGTRWLIAVTDADLGTERVLSVAATSEAAAAETFEAWAKNEPDKRACETFESVAALERDHATRVGDYRDDNSNSEPSALHDHLRGLNGTAERVGAGLVGRPLVSVRTTIQIISLFINEADERRADLFRGLRADTEELLDEGVVLLDVVCDTEEEFERARTAAETVIDIIYDEFAADLDKMGLDPRSVC